jgi:hypothetical protein
MEQQKTNTEIKYGRERELVLRKKKLKEEKTA